MEMNEKNIEKMGPKELFKLAASIESLTQKFQEGINLAQSSDRLEAKCACVHGTCDPGESTCARCYSGWHGRMCDIADNTSASDPRRNARQIADDMDDD